MIKKTIQKLSVDTHLPKDERVQNLETENAKLQLQVCELELKLQGSLPNGGFMASQGNLGSGLGLIFDKLKSKATRMGSYANKIMQSAFEVKSILRDVSSGTPSTNLQEEDKLYIELKQFEDDSSLGKRSSIEEDIPLASINIKLTYPDLDLNSSDDSSLNKAIYASDPLQALE